MTRLRRIPADHAACSPVDTWYFSALSSRPNRTLCCYSRRNRQQQQQQQRSPNCDNGSNNSAGWRHVVKNDVTAVQGAHWWCNYCSQSSAQIPSAVFTPRTVQTPVQSAWLLLERHWDSPHETSVSDQRRFAWRLSLSSLNWVIDWLIQIIHIIRSLYHV